jgi:hypothetical protein
LLTSAPLFNNLIDEKAEKILWVDAATSTNALGVVLDQKITPKDGEKHLPMSIDLDDQVHQIMYDHNLPYEPCRTYTSLPIEHLTPTQRRTLPPKKNS